MRNKIYFFLLLLCCSADLFAQQPVVNSDGKPIFRTIRIADTLTLQEKTNRNPVILQSELDSLIKEYNDSQVLPIEKEPIKESVSSTNQYIMIGLFVILALLGYVIYMFYRYHGKINSTIAGLKKLRQNDRSSSNGHLTGSTEKNGKGTPQSLENRIYDLNAELHKLSKENEGLNGVIKEYNGIQHEYDLLKHTILKGYKVKNYPGYDNTKDETMAMQGVLQTENAVALYAYEKFLKPILAITDSNKNNPAKLSASDHEKLLELLISLSLLYIEYLYLRINDLSVGGKMVERIKGMGKNNALDLSLLKKLNTDNGSRALVIKIALEKAKLHQLSYPVFDETNLNNQ